MDEFSRSPPHTIDQENEGRNNGIKKRLCDFCGDSKAILYCKADSAKLCLACDREVHSTNQLFTKHKRSQLCDVCDSSPASILCYTDNLVLCQNCDWETHNQLVSTVHNRRPLEGFTGCPTVYELCSIVGFECMDKKDLFSVCEESGIIDCSDEFGDYEFSDSLVWDSPAAIVSLDDLIGSTHANHGFKAMGVPPLPKNRNAVCGRHKEDLLHQLREMAKQEPDFNLDLIDVKPIITYQKSSASHINCKSCEHDAEPFVFPAYEASSFYLCGDGVDTEGTNEFANSTLLGRYSEESCLVVPEKHSGVEVKIKHASDDHEDPSHHSHPICNETSPIFAKVPEHEFNSQMRDTALLRYKEKKKTRRYDKHIRYESRKARADTRTRIKGRFAKIDH